MRLTAGGVEEAPLYSRFEVVTEHATAREEHVDFEVANNIWVLGSGGGVVRGASLFSILAGSAFRVASASAVGEAKGKLV